MRPVDPRMVTARADRVCLGIARNALPLADAPSWLTSVPSGVNFTLVTVPNEIAALLPN